MHLNVFIRVSRLSLSIYDLTVRLKRRMHAILDFLFHK